VEDTKQLVRELYAITAKLKALHQHRHFTPDGILVGSIGEVLAEYHYGLTPLGVVEPAHDCRHERCLVQVKTTQRDAIQMGEPCQHLIALKLLPDGSVLEAYNGPGDLVWNLVKDKPRPKNGLYPIRLKALGTLMESVPTLLRLPKLRD
jgi:hypothetical protein